MALINCPECDKKVSDRAQSCPDCGCPIAEGNREPIKIVHEQDSSFEKGFGENIGSGFAQLVIVFIVLAVLVKGC